MRSTEPIPGNPWPHDMVISVSDHQPLLEMLWIREAYDLQIEGDDLPPLLIQPPLHVLDPPSTVTRDEWEHAWPGLWREVLAHAGREDNRAMREQLIRTENGTADRLELLREMIGPTWRDEHGSTAFDHPSYAAWENTVTHAHRASRPTTLEDSPLRRDLEALIPAWHAGLTKIITIPCKGEYTKQVSRNALLITEHTQDASDTFRRALTTFG